MQVFVSRSNGKKYSSVLSAGKPEILKYVFLLLACLEILTLCMPLCMPNTAIDDQTGYLHFHATFTSISFFMGR